MRNFLLIVLPEELNFGGNIISLKEMEYVINSIIYGVIFIAVVLIVMFLVIKIGNKTIKEFVNKQVKSDAMLSLNAQKAKTIGEMLKSILKYSVYFIGITIIIAHFFGNISLTFASIGGVALGFGAQNLIKDIINGFFIIFENQFGVGDYITITNYSGIVKSIGIRTTVILDFNGDLHLIPNGNISEITNHSKEHVRFVVDVDIAYEEDIDNAIEVIKEVSDTFQQEYSEFIKEPVEVLGVAALGASGVTIRVVGKSVTMKRLSMEMELRKRIKMKLDEKGIEIPYNKVQIINNEKKGE
ncbi:mechanosensitive ion channel family protein [Clostridium sp. BJN0001]|uniref:mechanosensitive ion channel family protein n=1 Tax=Clostridium sp. BJN0001 TaxID=2930219 RepID=UPI001FD61CB6|nr:mechanosensitive ion channel family protein [Clostridium sp. BJN0001]